MRRSSSRVLFVGLFAYLEAVEDGLGFVAILLPQSAEFWHVLPYLVQEILSLVYVAGCSYACGHVCVCVRTCILVIIPGTRDTGVCVCVSSLLTLHLVYIGVGST